MNQYRLTDHTFTIDHYTAARAFASFLPGIAGVWGIPMWAFYVNRGQAIAGFGIYTKDHPIMEFLPANKAYRTVPLQGFRTFLKITAGSRRVFYEPFQPPAATNHTRLVQRMHIRMHELELEEHHPELNLETRVRYFTIPQEPFGALSRVVTLTNHGRRSLTLELLDGLPLIIPYGMQDRFLKNMSRTIEAWVLVENLRRRAPFYRLTVEPHDRPEVIPIRAGNFFVASASGHGGRQLLEPIVDPELIFGHREDGVVPARFLERAFRVPKTQFASEKTPCAMGYFRGTLRPGHTLTLSELFGHMSTVEELNGHLARITAPTFLQKKAAENAKLIETLTDPIATTSGLPVLDAYYRQSFLDNALRGGVPVILGDPTGPRAKRTIVYVFGRKHGDLERDYNHFIVPPTYFSQGNANFRDINQNRRSHVWFYPESDDINIRIFFNLIQLDGFNPLILRGTRFVVSDLAGVPPALRDVVSKPFTPGELLDYAKRHHIALPGSPDAFLERLLRHARALEEAEHGEGFWTDHWTYNLDLLESYLALYPDRLRALLLQMRTFTFYDNSAVVLPRSQKYHRVRGVIRQYHAVQQDREKAELIRSRATDPFTVRAQQGRGDIYTTTLLVKMLVVIANKLASLDPSGMGIEMEADKPNWYDALNGLPALVGSSVCETFELKRWLVFILEALQTLDLPTRTTVTVPEEVAELLDQLKKAMAKSGRAFWHASASAKEAYRQRTRLGVSGRERERSIEALGQWLQQALRKVTAALEKSVNSKTGLSPSYFYHEARASGESASTAITTMPTQWRRHALPLFLEGAVHALRLERNPAKARALYRAVRNSPLYDVSLRMYRICDSLQRESEEIGRCRVFSPGWLEHQSIWLHMECKWLLELLRGGLHEEFYHDFFEVLIPFQPPARYGRSVLENSSFLVSSAYADASLHGAGFVARLSGATAEVLQMWQWMTAGRQPFSVTQNGQVELRVSPVLAARLFDEKGLFRFTLLGHTQVTYRNPLHRSTFGAQAVAPTTIRLTLRSGGKSIRCDHGVIPAPYAEQVRRGLFASIEVDLAPAPARSSRRASARRVSSRV